MKTLCITAGGGVGVGSGASGSGDGDAAGIVSCTAGGVGVASGDAVGIGVGVGVGVGCVTFIGIVGAVSVTGEGSTTVTLPPTVIASCKITPSALPGVPLGAVVNDKPKVLAPSGAVSSTVKEMFNSGPFPLQLAKPVFTM